MAADQLTTTFAALADPTRRAILARLAQGDASVNELAEPFPISVQAVSKHLRVLERAGLVTRGRSAQLRPAGPRTTARSGRGASIVSASACGRARGKRANDRAAGARRGPHDHPCVRR